LHCISLKSTLAAMRILTLFAFLALQFSVFTCGSELHVHADDVHAGRAIEQAQTSNHEQTPYDAVCYAHTSHTFSLAKDTAVSASSMIHVMPSFQLAGFYVKQLSSSIEHPPQAQC